MYGHCGITKWTDAIELTVKTSWESGTSASKCSAEIYAKHGVSITRNGVIGKAHRLKWKTPNAPRSNLQERKPGKIRVRTRVPARTMRAREIIDREDLVKQRKPREPWHGMATALPPRRVTTGAPLSRNLTLLELAACDCRYATSPHEARVHLFCGAVTEENTSYCSHHLAVCHGRAS